MMKRSSVHVLVVVAVLSSCVCVGAGSAVSRTRRSSAFNLSSSSNNNSDSRRSSNRNDQPFVPSYSSAQCTQVREFIFASSEPSSHHASSPVQKKEDSDLCPEPSCCKKEEAGGHLRKHRVPQSWFNNSIKYNHFKTRLSTHIDFMAGTSPTGSNSSNLWNATLNGMRVLREWGVKYWDSQHFLDSLMSSECAAKVAQTAFCGDCTAPLGSGVEPCKGLCQNVVIGCLKTTLGEFIELPWKHAVNSVRTAARLIITNGIGDVISNETSSLQDLISDLNMWREPLSWWTSEQGQHPCDALPDNNCWNGETRGSYKHPVVNWRSNLNPEFTERKTTGSAASVHPTLILALDQFRSQLFAVKKSLEKFWPQTAGSLDLDPDLTRYPHALPLSSSEEIHGEGSGYEDDDLEYDSGGYNHPIDSDDEDLNPLEGSGSGSGETPPVDLVTPSTNRGDFDKPRDWNSGEGRKPTSNNNDNNNNPSSGGGGGQSRDHGFTTLIISSVLVLLSTS